MEGLRRKLAFRMNKNNADFEKTEMTAEFVRERQTYNDYNTAMTRLVQTLEGIIQPDLEVVREAKGSDDIVYPEDNSPWEEVETRLRDYREQVKNKSLALVEKTVSKAAKLVRPSQKKASVALNPMRRFISLEFGRFEQAMEKFDEAKNKMDMTKHEVKSCKNTMDLEKKAVEYKENVENFDVHCTRAIKVLEKLTRIQTEHEKALVQTLAAHRDYHRQMAHAFK